jgi:hypothetical protein
MIGVILYFGMGPVRCLTQPSHTRGRARARTHTNVTGNMPINKDLSLHLYLFIVDFTMLSLAQTRRKNSAFVSGTLIHYRQTERIVLLASVYIFKGNGYFNIPSSMITSSSLIFCPVFTNKTVYQFLIANSILLNIFNVLCLFHYLVEIFSPEILYVNCSSLRRNTDRGLQQFLSRASPKSLCHTDGRRSSELNKV